MYPHLSLSLAQILFCEENFEINSANVGSDNGLLLVFSLSQYPLCRQWVDRQDYLYAVTI